MEEALIGPDLTEEKTRDQLIDKALTRLGWTRNRDWVDEYELQGMPNHSEVGFADYVLFSDNGRPLAVIEAKRTSISIEKGRIQAKLYADLLEKKFGRRPVIFMTNGYDTHIVQPGYPERRVADFYSKRDLEKLFNLATERSTHISDLEIDKSISGRPYQISAIKAVCSDFEKKRRKALLVMATGSGKTRTVISLVDVLIRGGWIKNILFLADRNSLVTQAKRNFTNLLPSLSTTNLTETGYDVNARCIFSTYQTMINCIDTVKEDGKPIFTCGHFDLIITDEAHRSIYNRYGAIFDYFDSLLIGLTATPKDDIDRNTFRLFELPNGNPTYCYELAQAVEDGYLVNYRTIETKLKFLTEGIKYDDLPEDRRAEYEHLFVDEEGNIPDKVDEIKLNRWVFNTDTIERVLDSLMRNGLKVDNGSKIGKTIIFAKTHKHAEEIVKIFNRQYPSYGEYFCTVIDNQINYAQDAINDLSDENKKPQIAVSVDMLDTGIDIPSILNLVFFKNVYSKAKFWQMIGRGTRLCPGLIDGEDKDKFLIFDFCGNFEFFGVNPMGFDPPGINSIQTLLFMTKAKLAMELQKGEYQAEKYQNQRKELVEYLKTEVKKLERDNFAVRLHLRYVDLFLEEDAFDVLDNTKLKILKDEIAPLMLPLEGHINTCRFDYLMYMLELAHSRGSGKSANTISRIRSKAKILTKMSTIPDVASKMDILIQIRDNSTYLKEADIPFLEHIRQELRDLMVYLKGMGEIIISDFDDEIQDVKIDDSTIIEDPGMQNYRERAEYYIRKHSDNPVIIKLRTNTPLEAEDVSALEDILWREVGTLEEYRDVFGNKPLGQLVREISGLDRNAVNEAFADYLNNTRLTFEQRYFVTQIVEYIVRNGTILDFKVLQDSPFTDKGSLPEVFEDMTMWSGLKKIIQRFNDNITAH